MRFQIEGPDDIMRAYLVLSEQLGAPRGQCITQSVGELCSARDCKKGPSTWVRSNPNAPLHKAPKFKLVCMSCGRDWQGEEQHVLRDFNGGRRRVVEQNPRDAEMFELWHKVRAMVEAKPKHLTKSRWEYVTVCLVAFLDPRVGTYENVATYGLQHFRKRRGWTFTPARVRTAVREARDVLGKRGRLGGLLVNPVTAPHVRASRTWQ